MGRDGRCRGGLPADCDSAALRARIAVGPHQGQKALTLQTVPARAEGERDAGRRGRVESWRDRKNRIGYNVQKKTACRGSDLRVS